MRVLGGANWWAPRPLRAVHARFGIAETVAPVAAPVVAPAGSVAGSVAGWVAVERAEPVPH